MVIRGLAARVQGSVQDREQVTSPPFGIGVAAMAPKPKDALVPTGRVGSRLATRLAARLTSGSMPSVTDRKPAADLGVLCSH